MKPGFEQAYAPLIGFDFADEQSRENALWALHWANCCERCVGEQTFRPPLVIIQSTSAADNAALAARLAPRVKFLDRPRRPDELRKKLSVCAGADLRAVCIEEVDDNLLNHDALSRFVTPQKWAYRMLGTVEMVEQPLRTLLIMTVKDSVGHCPRGSAETMRRCVLIMLADKDQPL